MSDTDFIDEQIARGQLYAEVDPVFGNLIQFAGKDPYRLSGLMISYGLLRRELSKRPERVRQALAAYDAQMKRYVEVATKLAQDQRQARANAAAYFDASKQLQVAGGIAKQSTSGAGSVDSKDAATGEVTSYKVAAMGQSLQGLLQIADMFVAAAAERIAQGLSPNIFEPVLMVNATPVFSGWRTAAGYRRQWPDATDDQSRLAAGYWCQDIPVLSFMAPMVAAGLAIRYPANAQIYKALSLLCQAYPYGPPAPVALASVGNEGWLEVQSADGAYLVKWPDGPKVGTTIFGPCTVLQMVATFPPSAALTTGKPGWVDPTARALFYFVGSYHDGYQGRARQPYPLDYATPEQKSNLDGAYNQGVADRQAGSPDRYAGQAGLGDTPSSPEIRAPYDGWPAPAGLTGMVREQNAPAVYLVENGRLRWLQPAEFEQRGGAKALRIVPDGTFAAALSPKDPTPASPPASVPADAPPHARAAYADYLRGYEGAAEALGLPLWDGPDTYALGKADAAAQPKQLPRSYAEIAAMVQPLGSTTPAPTPAPTPATPPPASTPAPGPPATSLPAMTPADAGAGLAVGLGLGALVLLLLGGSALAVRRRRKKSSR